MSHETMKPVKLSRKVRLSRLSDYIIRLEKFIESNAVPEQIPNARAELSLARAEYNRVYEGN